MKIYKKISEIELTDYLNLVEDSNPLHYGIEAVLPGNFLLFILEKMYHENYHEQLKYIKTTFLSPAYSNKNLEFTFNQTNFQIKDRNQKVILKGEWKN